MHDMGTLPPPPTTLACTLLDVARFKVYGDAQESPQTESYWGNVNCHGKREP